MSPSEQQTQEHDDKMDRLDERHLTAISQAVEEAVKKTVNGKIDRLHLENTAKMADIDTKLDELKESIAPIVEGLNTMKGFRKFLLYWGPAIATIGAAVMWVKNK